VQNTNDVDYLGTQGYWVCAFVAFASLVFFVFSGQALLGISVALFYYLGGVGVRERSTYAAAVVLVMYFLDIVAGGGPNIVRILIIALLISNLRATWIASHWRPETDESFAPPRFSDTWTDKFADKWPMWLWPKIRVLYYVFSACALILAGLGLLTLLGRRSG